MIGLKLTGCWCGAEVCYDHLICCWCGTGARHDHVPPTSTCAVERSDYRLDQESTRENEQTAVWAVNARAPTPDWLCGNCGSGYPRSVTTCRVCENHYEVRP